MRPDDRARFEPPRRRGGAFTQQLAAAILAGFPRASHRLHKLVPAAETIAFLSRSRTSDFVRVETRNLQSAADVLGLRLLPLNALDESEVAPAFATLVEQHAGALLLSSNAFSAAAHAQIISLAARDVVPTMYAGSIQVEAGGLVSFGSDRSETFGLLGSYVGRILRPRAGTFSVVPRSKRNLSVAPRFWRKSYSPQAATRLPGQRGPPTI
jgi:ABC-type uncharacterized transport system substrate-binding protein